MTKQWTNKEKFDILEFGSAKTYVGEKTLQKSEEGIFQDERAIKTQRCGKPPKNTKSSCTVCTSEAVLNTAQQLSTAAWISNKQTSLNLSRKPALEYFLMLTTFLMDQPWFNRAVLSLKQRRKTSQEFRMLSRSLSDCKSLLLNVMIQVSQFVSNSQLCH